MALTLPWSNDRKYVTQRQPDFREGANFLTYPVRPVLP
jgi:hypothetical protein